MAKPADVIEQPVNLGTHDVGRIPVGPDTPAKESPLPDARVETGRTAFDRQLPQNRKPARQPRMFRVSVGGGTGNDTALVEALDEGEAWAKFCDGRKDWPSPRMSQRKIELVKAGV